MGPVSEKLVPAELREDEVLLVPVDEVLHDHTPCEVLLIPVVIADPAGCLLVEAQEVVEPEPVEAQEVVEPGPQHEVGVCRHHAERHAQDMFFPFLGQPLGDQGAPHSPSSQHGESTSKLTNDSSEKNSKP